MGHPNTNSILGAYLFKENKKKEKIKSSNTTPSKPGSKKNKSQLFDEDLKFQKIRDDKELKRSYLSTLSARYNPDLLVGSVLDKEIEVSCALPVKKVKIQPQFIRGNEYFSELHRNSSEKDKKSVKKEKDIPEEVQNSP